ncbi:hypothetical protein R1479_01686 [Ralstonia mannitolilytica]|uniref:PAAR domain-containing protein n=1 Tax=Ralstonia mannitolilytica TaxID=105219 RepID=UPI0028F6630E|nr:PAAR domain-containing protein [Ralstonia mannitolilytica]CAJ0714610.1 hypothetical protein LMG8323_02645 [Ralstonia mannitolilytica]CAJ0870282.1 hypothetical protein R1479_01686 [Ralstonia mannitolilytica]
MTDRRCALRHGDTTSTGGVLIATGQGKHRGIQLAVEGDLATCPACRSIGQVVNDCHPAFALKGKQVLVEGARVYCRCANPPTCFASQNSFTIVVNRAGDLNTSVGFREAAHPNTPGRAQQARKTSALIFDEQFLLKDGQGNALSNTYYTVRLPSGEIRYGTTDVHGRTERIRTDGAQEIRVYIGHVSNV